MQMTTGLKTPMTNRWPALGLVLLALGCLQYATAPRANAVEPAAPPELIEADLTTHSPQWVIEHFHAGLIEIMKEAKELGFQGRSDKLAPLMQQTFDLEFMASKTVGRLWRKLSDEDQRRWAEIFARFTTANYAGRFTGYDGEEFVTVGVEDAPRDTQIVLTKIIVPDGDDVRLNYRMIERDGIWKVIDVFLNGTVSELALRRSEYSSALKRHGFEQLVASVETKIEDLKTKGGADG